MSEDDRDIDIESDDDDSDTRLQHRNVNNNQNFSQADKRAHHNALERRRRDHIKDSFTCLREAVPSLQGEKVASRAQILKKAAEYIQFMRRKNHAHQQDIDDLKKQNLALEMQIKQLENTKETISVSGPSDIQKKLESSDNSDADDNEIVGRQSKKLRTDKR